MNKEIPILTYNNLERVKYGEKYLICEDSNKLYHCFSVDDKTLIFVRPENKETGVVTFVDKEKSKLQKTLIGFWDDFEVFPIHPKKVENAIKEMEANEK